MKVETGQYYTVERRKEVADSARKLRRQYLRYKEAEIVYSIQHKKLLELAGIWTIITKTKVIWSVLTLIRISRSVFGRLW